MQLSDFQTNLKGNFPHRDYILSYIREYYKNKELSEYIKFNTCVKNVFWDKYIKKWRVTHGEESVTCFDFVFVCVGRYTYPYYPDIKNIDKLMHLYPNKVFHSKYYRNNKRFKNKVFVAYI